MIITRLTFQHARSGLTLVEVIIGLALTAMLFTAIGVSVSAAIRTMQVNDSLSSTVNTSRATLGYLTTVLRQARNCALLDSSTTVPAGITLGTDERLIKKAYMKVPGLNGGSEEDLYIAVVTDTNPPYLAISRHANLQQATGIEMKSIALIGTIANYANMTTAEIETNFNKGELYMNNIRIVGSIETTKSGVTTELPLSTSIALRKQ